ncbi:hypothetical protein N7478_010497 [Penicillium angulare]|uniref:uncharacterized protein n=1 Tax=Penicillium angulare TaxID=116970 RepID=UPI0025418B5F|nr:uncharacterized protein N7478_010497 [Penicillium angulare]KAJ5267689.1 hypothetical protein N7478_010497 [Penicillium angulare]
MSIYTFIRLPHTPWKAVRCWYNSDKNILSQDVPRPRSESRYARMLREEAEVQFTYNIIASTANWVLLAGYLVVPGTFTSLQTSNQVESALNHNGAGRHILHTIHNPPLLGIACLFLMVGAFALLWLFHFRQLRYVYTWLINKIFMPVSLNAAAGLLTTLVNIYTSRAGHWSVMALATAVITGFTTLAFSLLFCVYRFQMLKNVMADRRLLHS